jgi:hypothetical protein
MSTDDAHAERLAALSFNRSGPFYRLQRRLGLIGERDLNVSRRALLFAALAWLPALLLAAAQGLAWSAAPERAWLLDFRVHAFAIAIAAFVLMERSADQRLGWLLGQFIARGIVGEATRPALLRTHQASLRRTGSVAAEAVMLLLAYAASWLWLSLAAAQAGDGWIGPVVDGRLRPSWAGGWVLLVTAPLYGFLLLRWLWRFGCWALLLRDLARCELRLVATHADRCGGLSFVSRYPGTYTLFVFAFSTVVSAGVLRQIVYHDASLMNFKFEAAGLVLFVLVAFALPLFAFTPLLLALKRRGLADYGALVSHHKRAFEARWIGGARQAGYQLVERVKPVPLSKASVVPLLVGVLLPVLVVAATQIPFKQLLGALKALVLV